jgi:hypothetical protein
LFTQLLTVKNPAPNHSSQFFRDDLTVKRLYIENWFFPIFDNWESSGFPIEVDHVAVLPGVRRVEGIQLLFYSLMRLLLKLIV